MLYLKLLFLLIPIFSEALHKLSLALRQHFWKFFTPILADEITFSCHLHFLFLHVFSRFEIFGLSYSRTFGSLWWARISRASTCRLDRLFLTPGENFISIVVHLKIFWSNIDNADFLPTLPSQITQPCTYVWAPNQESNLTNTSTGHCTAQNTNKAMHTTLSITACDTASTHLI